MKNFEVDSYQAKILQNLYAGESGECYSFLQMLFQKNCLAPYSLKIKSVLDSICEDDERHINILAQHIVLLGKTPYLKNASGQFLSAKNLCNETSQSNMLFANIKLKEQSIVNYKSAILKIKDVLCKRELEKIVQEEQVHLQLLKNLQKTINCC